MTGKIVLGVVVIALLWAGAWFVYHNKDGASARDTSSGQVSSGSSSHSGGPSAGGDPSAMRERFTQFREEHKFTFQLTGLVGNIARLEREGANKLTAQQAKEILGIMQPLRSKEKLTQDDAKDTIRGLQRILTTAQRDEIAKMPEMRRGSGPGGPGGAGPRGQGGSGAPGGSGGPGRPGGGNRQRGERPRFDPAAMKNFNPFNSSSTGPTGARGAARWDTLMKELEKKAAK